MLAELEPKHTGFYNARAWDSLKAGRAAEGLPCAERAQQLNPGLVEALDTRGHIFEALVGARKPSPTAAGHCRPW